MGSEIAPKRPASQIPFPFPKTVQFLALIRTLTPPTPCIKPLDNLYLDMNGIIHNCSHSDDSNDAAFSQLSENDMFGKVLQYIDHIFSVVMPRKLLYLAIDGT